MSSQRVANALQTSHFHREETFESQKWIRPPPFLREAQRDSLFKIKNDQVTGKSH